MTPRGVEGCLAVLAVAFFAPAIFFGQVPMFRDFATAFLPFKLYAAHSLASGRLPLWCPEMAFGTPFLANYLSGVLYPPSAIVDLLPLPTGVGLYLAFHFWVAGCGMNLLLRRRGLSWRAGAFGAVVFMFGGVMISIAPWGHLAVVSWIPLALVAIQDLVRDPRSIRLAWLVLVLVLELLGGGPESFVLGAGLGAGAALCAARRSDTPIAGPFLAAVAAALAVGISAFQLFPTLEYFMQTERSGGLGASMSMSQSLDPRSFLTLVLPHRLDGGLPSGIVEAELPVFWSIYLGLAPLALVIAAIVTGRGVRWALVLTASLLLALGSRFPIYRAAYAARPELLGAFRYPQKLLLVAHVATAVLAGYGYSLAESVAAGLPARLRGPLAAVVIALTIADLWDVHHPALLFTDWASLVRSAPPATPGGIRNARFYGYQVRAAGLEAWLPEWRFDESLLDRQRQLWSDLAGNVPLVYGIGFTNGHDGFVFARQGIGALDRALRALPIEAGVHLLRSLAVDHLIGEQVLDARGLTVVRRGDGGAAWIYAVVDPAPRLYFARRFSTQASLAETYRALADEQFSPGADVVLAAPFAGHARGDLPSGLVTMVEDAPRRLRFEVSLEGDGLLVLADSFFPGWQAAVDGEPTQIVRANGLARAIALPGGRHQLSVAYEPASFRIGCRVSAASLIALVAVLAVMSSAGSPGDRPPGSRTGR